MKTDETKMNQVETNQNETNQVETNQNETNQVETNQNETARDNMLYFEIPLSEVETMEMFTEFLKTKRGMRVQAHTGQFKKGQLFVGVLPDGIK